MVLPGGSDIPQVLAVPHLHANGKITLTKQVRAFLGLGAGAPVYLQAEREVLLSPEPGGTEVPTSPRGDLTLPGPIVARLGLAAGARVAIIQRPAAVALKCAQLTQEPGECARLVDREGPDVLVRVVRTNPDPRALVPRLVERYRGSRLRYDVRPWLAHTATLEAWRARKLLRRPGPDDESLRQRLIADIGAAQRADGSWEGSVPRSARRLRELAQLGVGRGDSAVARAAAWLLGRPESPHNPGMFFAGDGLVARQMEIVAGRRAGVRGRFREIRATEQQQVMLGDDLMRMPCGPRIMWPNALVLEALIAAGYEDVDRVQRALTFMASHDWCECGYQHGLADWRQAAPMSDEDLVAFEARCRTEYHSGGVGDLEQLLTTGAPQGLAGPPRVAVLSASTGELFALRLEGHIQGCEFVTTRSVWQARHPRVRCFAAAHLWRFAGRQHAEDGAFGPEKYGSGFDQAGVLETFARYDHPVAPVVILRAVPWIVANQNADGTWGRRPEMQGAATLAVLTALASLGEHTPEGLRC